MDKAPKRPKTVPFGARWAAPLWQYGTEGASGEPDGQWCGWKKKGALAYVAQLKDGVLDGPTVEFHPDGGLFRRATYRAGKPVGLEEFFAAASKSDEIFPAEKPVARVVVDHRASPPTQTYFLADGAPCNMHGTPLSALFADAPFLVKDVDAFFKAGLPAYFKHRIKVAPSDAARAKMTPEPGLSKELARQWGIKPKGAMKSLLTAIERGRIPARLGAFTPEPVSGLSALAHGASVEGILTRAQRTEGGVPAIALFAGLVPFARREDGVVVTAVHDDGDALAYVLTPGGLRVQADDAGRFVIFETARDALAQGMLSPRARAHLAKLFAGHLAATSLGDARWDAAALGARETRASARFRRGAWLAALFAGAPLDAVIDAYEGHDAGPLDRALASRVDRPDVLAPPELVYSAFRAWLTQDVRLPAVLEVADRSKSALVVSASQLVREITGGRRRLGVLKDLEATRRAVVHALFTPR